MNAMVRELEREQAELRTHIINILWHMRGGLTRNDAWSLAPQERADIMKYIEERLKIVEKTKLPLL